MSLKLMNSARFYDFSIDRLRCVLQLRDQPVSINRKTFDLLVYLIDHRARLVTKDELLENLWPAQFVEESNLTQHVFLLRKALSAQGGDQKIIQTISRRGYRFTAPLDEDELQAERMILSATEAITRVTVEEEEVMASVTSPLAALGCAPGRESRFGWVLAWSFAVVLLGFAGWFNALTGTGLLQKMQGSLVYLDVLTRGSTKKNAPRGRV